MKSSPFSPPSRPRLSLETSPSTTAPQEPSFLPSREGSPSGAEASHPPRLRPSAAFRLTAAFTLVELMTVIAVILVLMGMLFPAVDSVKNSARRSQAKNDVMQVTNAVKHYFTEYGKYPNVQNAAGGSSAGTGPQPDVLLGSKSGGLPAVMDNAALFNVLRAISRTPNDEHSLNPRRIVYFEGRAVSDPTSPKGGFLDKASGTGSQGSFYDPWGNQYYVLLDTNYDNALDTNQAYSDFSAEDDKPKTGAGAFSLGKDGVVGDAKGARGSYRNGQTLSDDVVSWQ
jgi:type II secretory pathway pseudopilin PulG